MRRAAIAVVLLSLVACGSKDAADPPASSSPSPAGHDLTVEASLGWFSTYSAFCGVGGCSTGTECISMKDFTKGVQVADGSHTVVGVTRFENRGSWVGGNNERGRCVWSVTVPVPDVPIYILNTGLGTKTLSSEQLAADGWTVSLGDPRA